MALNHLNITVGTTPTLLATMPNGVGYVAVNIFNNDNSPIFVGDNAVTSAAGANQGSQIVKGTNIQFWLHGNDSIYAVSAAGTTAGAVSVIYSA
jgi:hypothetical protein